MDLSIIYAKTPKGVRLRKSLFGGLPAHLMKIMALVDGKTSAQNILNQLDGFSEQKFIAALSQIENEGYIKAVEVIAQEDDWELDTFFAPMVVEEVYNVEEIDGTAELETYLELEQIAKKKEAERREDELKAREIEAQIRAKEIVKAEAKIRQKDAEEQARRAQEAELERQKAEAEAREQAAMKAKAQAKFEAQEKARVEAERIAREVELATIRAEAEAAQEKAKLEIEHQEKLALAARAQVEKAALEAAEKERAIAEAEAQAKHAAEEASRLAAARIAEQEAKAQEQAEHAARLKAERQAQALVERIREKERQRREEVRLAKEAEEARIQAELAQAEEVARLAAKIKAREEQEAAEAQTKAEEAARIEAEHQQKLAQEAQAQAELATKLEAERLQAIAQAEEAARLAAEEQARLEAERIAQVAEEARIQAEAQAIAQSEEADRVAAEIKAREEQAVAEAQAKVIAEEAARLEAEQQAKLAEEAQLQAQAQAELAAKLEAERLQAIAQAEEAARLAAEAQARLEAERIAREAEAAQKKAEAEARALAKKEAKLKVERQAKRIAEAKAHEKAAAKEQAKLEKARIAKEKAEREAQKKAEREAQKEAERLAKQQKEAAIAEQKAAEKAAREEAKNLASEMMGHKPQRAKNSLLNIAKAKYRKFDILVLSRFKGDSNVRQPKKWLSPLLKFSMVYMPILLILLLGLMHVVPLNFLAKPVEHIAAASIGAPVGVGEVRASLWPQPHFMLRHVAVGENPAFQVDSVTVAPQVTSLFSDVKTLDSVLIEGVALEQKDFAKPLQWLQAASQSPKLQVHEVRFSKVKLNLRDLELAPLRGHVMQHHAGQFGGIALKSEEGALAIEVQPQAGQYRVKIRASQWALPVQPNIVFDELNAIGLYQNARLQFDQLQGEIYGGIFSAKAVFDWSSQWQTSGSFNMTKVNAAQLLKAFASTGLVEGKLNLAGNFSAQSTIATQLLDDAEVTGNFQLPNGKISGVDLPRAILNPEDKALEGYATNFDQLSGDVRAKSGRIEYRNLVLKSPKLQAQGHVQIAPDEAISGKISLNAVAQGRSFQSTFDLTGKVSNVKRF